MFREFGLLLYDYIFTLSKKSLVFDFVIPGFLTSLLLLIDFKSLIVDDSFIGQVITLLGILAGFNITAITMLTTTSNSQIEKLKEVKGGILDGNRITLFKQLYINISYSVLASFFVILFEVFGYIISVQSIFGTTAYKILALLNVWMVLHIIFLNIRNITFIYFSFLGTKKEDQKFKTEKDQ